MRCFKWVAGAVTGIGLCHPGLAYTPTVRQYAQPDPPYVKGVDYQVSGVWEKRITILRPSISGYPYDFDCFDADDPNHAASIRLIDADPNTAGTFEFMLRGHDGRQFGATDVRRLSLGSGVIATILEFNISGVLGQDGDSYTDTVLNAFQIGNLQHNFNIVNQLNGALTLTDPNGTSGNLSAYHFEDPGTITINGPLYGSLSLGNQG
jgi:hypothetical protein